ncbi:MAG: UDP-N-acetylglucosamine 1-carboxyvinyltransferase [Clostridiales bacterium]|nr:UDP-N-acetylglucosamine 1-carboxyvinyltransferase [Clostridiales bacterium]
MSRFIINGGNRVYGETRIQGSKNSVLPILAATVLVKGETVISNCPDISDVNATIKVLRYLGCKVTFENHTVTVDSTDMDKYDIPDDLMREMRSSVIFLGGIIGRMGKARLSTPGGCEIGLRPIDLHLDAIQRFGVNIKEEFAKIEFESVKPLEGTNISLSFPSVGATENIILTACLAKGTTIITNAAREPEITDLADFLNRCGARISGSGEGTIVIEGVENLHSVHHKVIPDRIAASTYMAAAAMTQGKIRLNSVIPAHIAPVIPVFEEAGCDISIEADSVTLTAPPRLKSIKTIRTMPYPGFPTDMQAPVMAMTTVCRGTSVIIETIFESRYKHVSELLRFGAKIRVDGRMSVIEGVDKLTGASVISSDLRGGAALVLAGIAAQGITTVDDIKFIERGYESMENVLGSLGCDIKKEEREITDEYGDDQGAKSSSA